MTSNAVRIPARIAGVALGAVLLAFPVGVAANTNEPIAATGGMTTQIWLMGTSLSVDVTLTPVGDILAATLNSTTLMDPAKTKTKTDSVTFSNTAGTAKVSVRAKGDKLSISAKGTLAGLVGGGTWSAKVFGTGTLATVPYKIGNVAGTPTLHIDPAVTVGAVIATPIVPVTKTEEGKVEVKGGVTFTKDGFVKRLMISIETRGDGLAQLKITLSGKDRQNLSGALGTLTGAVGSRTWSGHLCDGTALTVLYHVAADGTVMYDSTTSVPAGATATVRTTHDGFVVRFDKTNVSVKVELKNVDGTYTLKVDGRSGNCGEAKGHDKGHGASQGHDKSQGHGESQGQASARINGKHH
jgi:hypothetical protein